MLAEFPTHTDQNCPNSCLLNMASNEDTCPNNLCVLHIPNSGCDFLTHYFYIFLLSLLSISPHLPRIPAHFLHGSVISLFLQWIGFQLLSQARRLLSLGFCHLSKTHCHFHSSSPSLPLYPLLLAPCLYLLKARVVCVCNPNSVQPNWNVADYKHHGNNFCKQQGRFPPPIPAFLCHLSPFLFFLLSSSPPFSCVQPAAPYQERHVASYRKQVSREGRCFVP